jgi:hypothetical protein
MDDAGLYMVKGINIDGEVKCSGLLTILPSINNIQMKQEQTNIQPNGFSPEFLQLFTDQQTTLNSTVKLEARLIGSQPLNVTKILFLNFNFDLFFSTFRFIGYLMDHQY